MITTIGCFISVPPFPYWVFFVYMSIFEFHWCVDVHLSWIKYALKKIKNFGLGWKKCHEVYLRLSICNWPSSHLLFCCQWSLTTFELLNVIQNVKFSNYVGGLPGLFFNDISLVWATRHIGAMSWIGAHQLKEKRELEKNIWNLLKMLGHRLIFHFGSNLNLSGGFLVKLK